MSKRFPECHNWSCDFTWHPPPGNVSPCAPLGTFPIFILKAFQIIIFTQTCYPLILIFFLPAVSFAFTGTKQVGLHRNSLTLILNFLTCCFPRCHQYQTGQTLYYWSAPWLCAQTQSEISHRVESEWRNNKYCASAVTPTTPAKDVQRSSLQHQAFKNKESVISWVLSFSNLKVTTNSIQ